MAERGFIEGLPHPCLRDFVGDKMVPRLRPVVIGGLGDSGTRAVRNVMQFLGVEIPASLPTQDNTQFLSFVKNNFLHGTPFCHV